MIHPVIHVSQLRQALPPATEACQELPQATQAKPEPVRMLETKLYQRGGETRTPVRVQWRDQPAELATWEDQNELIHLFPAAPAWGQAGPQPGENVTSPATATTATSTSTTATSTSKTVHSGPKETGPASRQGARVRRPNPRYT